MRAGFAGALALTVLAMLYVAGLLPLALALPMSILVAVLLWFRFWWRFEPGSTYLDARMRARRDRLRASRGAARRSKDGPGAP